MTVAEIIKAAARAKGAIDRYNDLDASEYAEGLAALNSMLALWSAEGITTYNILSDNFPLVPGKTVYTIGPVGADVVTGRPIDIYYAFVRTINNVDIPVEVLTDEEFDAITLKTVTFRPNQMQYRPTMPNGTITVYPVPSYAESLFIQSQKPLGNFTSIDDDINLPSEMEEAIKYNLALRVVPEVAPSAMVLQLASDGKRTIYTVPVPAATFDTPGLGTGRFNIYKG